MVEQKNPIRDLQYHARILIMLSANKWLEAITPHLWPYAICLANEVQNHSPSNCNGLIPIAGFARTSRVPDFNHLHTFGFPAYVLMPELQEKKKIDKQAQRRNGEKHRVGIYLGPSPAHSRSVPLILSLSSG